MRDAADAFNRQRVDPQANIKIVSGPSSGLAQQIIHGGTVDIFVSANPKWADSIGGKQIDSYNLLLNRLALATNSGNASNIRSIKDLSSPSVRSIAVAGANVPIGDYANQVIERLPAGEREAVKSKLVFAKDAGALVAWMESDQVDAAFVYASDVSRSESLRLIEMVEETQHDPIVYSVSRIVGGDKSAELIRDEFFMWLQSNRAKAIFLKHGFSVPSTAIPSTVQ